MDRKLELNDIVKKRNLLNHPFYQAWSMGTLSVEALQVYAREYGAFIQTLPQGWLTLNDAETAGEEKEHAELWSHFSAGLNVKSGITEIEETGALVDKARTLFSSPSTALGALYAFEIQQPATAESKLDGLKKWYKLPDSAEEYFIVHTTNWHESEKILTQINSLPLDEQEKALEACREFSEALWNGLTGIYNKACTS